MSYIFATGCSWTDKNFMSTMEKNYDTSYPKWPELVSAHFNIPHINAAESGSDLLYSFKSILSAIASETPPSAVIWQLTQWTRIHFPNRYLHVGNFCKGVNIGKQWFPLEPWLFCLSVAAFLKSTPGEFMENALYYINTIRTICKKLDIRLFIFTSDLAPLFGKIQSSDRVSSYFNYIRMIKSVNTEVWKTMISYFENEKDFMYNLGIHEKFYQNNHHLMHFIRNPIFQKIEGSDPEEDIYGWPFFPDLGGKIISHKGNAISKNDGHPNARGQEVIAKDIIRELEYRKWSFKK